MVQSSLFSETAPEAPAIPVNASVHPAEAPRLSNQCRLILERLRANGGRATNRELADVSLKYTGRISDLRAAGYVITVVERNHETGLNVYALKGDPGKT